MSIDLTNVSREPAENLFIEGEENAINFCVNYECLKTLVGLLEKHINLPKYPMFNKYHERLRESACYYIANDLTHIRECVTEMLNNMKAPVELEDSEEYGLPGTKTMFKRFKDVYQYIDATKQETTV